MLAAPATPSAPLPQDYHTAVFTEIQLAFSTYSNDGSPLVGSEISIRGPQTPVNIVGDGGGQVKIKAHSNQYWTAVVSAPGHRSRLVPIDLNGVFAANGSQAYEVILSPFSEQHGLFVPGFEPTNSDGLVEIAASPMVNIVGNIKPHDVTITYPAGHIAEPYIVQFAAAGGAMHDPAGPRSLGTQIDRLIGEVHVQFLHYEPGHPNHLQVIDTAQMPDPGCTIRYEPIHAASMYLPEELDLLTAASALDITLGTMWRFNSEHITWGVQGQGSVGFDGDTGEVVINIPGFSGYSPVLDRWQDIQEAVDLYGAGKITAGPITTPHIPDIVGTSMIYCKDAGGGNIQCGRWAGPAAKITKGTKVDGKLTLGLGAEFSAQVGISGSGLAKLVSKAEAEIGVSFNGSIEGLVSTSKSVSRDMGFENGDIVTVNPCMSGEGNLYDRIAITELKVAGITIATREELVNIVLNYDVQEIDACPGCDIHDLVQKESRSYCQ